jgi:hypothetical protein
MEMLWLLEAYAHLDTTEGKEKARVLMNINCPGETVLRVPVSGPGFALQSF